MRPLLACLLAIALSCAPEPEPQPPPLDAFYFPSAVRHVDSPQSPEGLLYVASTNFDLRFDFGAVFAVDLSAVSGPDGGLPPLGAPVPLTGPRQLADLALSNASIAFIGSFAGQMGAVALPDGGTRLFIPSRGEGSRLHVLEAPGLVAGAPALSCLQPAQGGGNNCIPGALSLEVQADPVTGLPRAPDPFGVAATARGVFVTHLARADSPAGSQRDYQSFLVAADPADPELTADSYIPLGGGGATHGVAVGARYAYVSGRYVDPAASLIRLVDIDTRNVIQPGLEWSLRVLDGRGIALDPLERRAYVLARNPDMLAVVGIENPGSDSPLLRVVQNVPLPEGASELVVIPRAGRGNLVAITCAAAGVVVFYDDDAGTLVAQLPGVGEQPFGIALDERGPAARLYVTNFGDGRVAVIDVPELLDPSGARVVAHLGARQTCLTTPEDAACVGVAP